MNKTAYKLARRDVKISIATYNATKNESPMRPFFAEYERAPWSDYCVIFDLWDQNKKAPKTLADRLKAYKEEKALEREIAELPEFVSDWS